MNSKYKVLKYSSNKFENIDDLISIEEPLEISLKYKESDKWINQSLSITMRTPGDDEDLVRGFLYNEQIIKSKRDFLTNSSCGVCGKSSLDALEIIKTTKTNASEPKISKDVIIQSPDILREGQSEFSKTGGIHASGLFNSDGKLIALREDVGRHNALDKLIGCALEKKQFDPKDQFITCSGRLNFELVQKVLMTDIGIMIGVGAPTSLAIDLANKFDITLVGFVKRDSFNIYTNNKKVIVD